MIKKSAITIILILAIFTISAFSQVKTEILDQKVKTMLLGKHRLSLQWISWDYFGTANVINKSGVFYLKGSQLGRGDNKSDSLMIDGVITSIGEREFKFNGKIVTQISHINAGKPCEREGEMTFAVTKNRRYWRLQEMQNSCEDVLDYVDVYFR